MLVETLSNFVDEKEKQILLIELGYRKEVPTSTLARLLIKEYKNNKNYIGYKIIGDESLQQTEIKELRKLLNWNEIKDTLPI